MDTVQTTLAKAIQIDREKTKISQEQIAVACGVTQQAVSGWEAGQTLPRTPKLRKLVELFGAESETAKIAEVMQWARVRHGRPGTGISPIPPHVHALAVQEKEPAIYGELRSRRNKDAHGVGMQSGPDDKEPMHDRRRTSIPSFESPPLWSVSSPPTPATVEALNRAANGVKLARQVLEDAAAQLAQAIASIPR